MNHAREYSGSKFTTGLNAFALFKLKQRIEPRAGQRRVFLSQRYRHQEPRGTDRIALPICDLTYAVA